MGRPITKKKLPTPIGHMTSGPYEKHVPLSKQKENKIKMFEKDFGFKLTFKELELINNATDEHSLDRAGRQVIINHFGDE